MNPETKATIDQIKAICKKYGIEYKSHSRITIGFSNELHRINDDLVIKIYNTYGNNESTRFNIESELLASDAPFLKPKLIASDGSRELIDRDYIIIPYIQGKNLGSVWHLATDSQREELIKTISDSLKIINTLKISSFDQSEQQSWEEKIGKRIDGYIVNLLTKSIIDDQKAQEIHSFLNKNREVLSGSKLYPVFWDVHFDNFIVDDDFNLLAMIDLESVRMDAMDYPLFVIQKLMNNPALYLSEEDEKYANKEDYKHLREWYQKYYPEMFEFKDLDKRVNIYMLLDTLHMLEDWSHIKRLYEELETYLQAGY